MAWFNWFGGKSETKVQKSLPQELPAFKASIGMALRPAFAGAYSGGWVSDHREESEHNTGWNHVAINAIAQQMASATVTAYFDGHDVDAKRSFRKSLRELYGSVSRYRSTYKTQYGNDDDETQPLAPDHPLMRLLRQPNPYETGGMFRYRQALQLRLTGSCFPAGTPVKMADGTEKAIENVVEGDIVVSHIGKARKVTGTASREFTGEMITLSVARYPFPLTMTSDHKVAVLEDWIASKTQHEPRCITWRRAGDIKTGDRVLLNWLNDEESKEISPVVLDTAEIIGEKAIILDDVMSSCHLRSSLRMDKQRHWSLRYEIKKSKIDWKGKVHLFRSRLERAIYRHIAITPSLGRLIGLYLAEGSCSCGRITFDFHENEETTLAAETLSLVRGIFGIDGKIVRRKGSRGIAVRFNSKTMEAFMKEFCPGNAYSKRIPPVLMTCDRSVRIALIHGWIDGDGHNCLSSQGEKTWMRISGATVSPGLARDVVMIALSCGIRASSSKRPPQNGGICKGRQIQSRKPVFSIFLSGEVARSFYPEMASQETKRKNTDIDNNRTKFGYSRYVEKIETEIVEKKPVYDFEVDEDHSFIAGGIAVHNCFIWNVPSKGGPTCQRYVIPVAMMTPQMPTSDRPFGSYLIQPNLSRAISFDQDGYVAGSPIWTMLMGASVDARQIQKVGYPHAWLLDDFWSPVSAVSKWIDQADAIDVARFSQMKNGVDGSVFVELPPDYQPDQDEMDRLSGRFAKKYGGPDNVGVAVMGPNGMKVTPLSTVAKDMSYAEGFADCRDAILAAHGTPGVAVGSQTATSQAGWLTGMRQWSYSAIKPMCQMLAESDTMILGPQFGHGITIEIEPEEINDEQERNARCQVAISAQSITKNTLNATLGFKLLDGPEGEKLVGKADTAANGANPGVPNGGLTSPPSPSDPNDPYSASMRGQTTKSKTLLAAMEGAIEFDEELLEEKIEKLVEARFKALKARDPSKPYKFSSTQINLPKTLAEQVKAMGMIIPDDVLTDDGREDEIHATILYGLTG